MVVRFGAVSQTSLHSFFRSLDPLRCNHHRKTADWQLLQLRIHLAHKGLCLGLGLGRARLHRERQVSERFGNRGVVAPGVLCLEQELSCSLSCVVKTKDFSASGAVICLDRVSFGFCLHAFKLFRVVGRVVFCVLACSFF